jgi:hypothetical protein
MKLGIGKKNPWKILYRDCSFRFDTFTNIAGQMPSDGKNVKSVQGLDTKC